MAHVFFCSIYILQHYISTLNTLYLCFDTQTQNSAEVHFRIELNNSKCTYNHWHTFHVIVFLILYSCFHKQLQNIVIPNAASFCNYFDLSLSMWNTNLCQSVTYLVKNCHEGHQLPTTGSCFKLPAINSRFKKTWISDQDYFLSPTEHRRTTAWDGWRIWFTPVYFPLAFAKVLRANGMEEIVNFRNC